MQTVCSPWKITQLAGVKCLLIDFHTTWKLMKTNGNLENENITYTFGNSERLLWNISSVKSSCLWQTLWVDCRKTGTGPLMRIPPVLYLRAHTNINQLHIIETLRGATCVLFQWIVYELEFRQTYVRAGLARILPSRRVGSFSFSLAMKMCQLLKRPDCWGRCI